MTEDEERLALAADLVAAAVLRDDPALRVAAALVLGCQPHQPVTFSYKVAESVVRALTFVPDYLPTNGDAPE